MLRRDWLARPLPLLHRDDNDCWSQQAAGQQQGRGQALLPWPWLLESLLLSLVRQLRRTMGSSGAQPPPTPPRPRGGPAASSGQCEGDLLAGEAILPFATESEGTPANEEVASSHEEVEAAAAVAVAGPGSGSDADVVPPLPDGSPGVGVGHCDPATIATVASINQLIDSLEPTDTALVDALRAAVTEALGSWEASVQSGGAPPLPQKIQKHGEVIDLASLKLFDLEADGSSSVAGSSLAPTAAVNPRSGNVRRPRLPPSSGGPSAPVPNDAATPVVATDQQLCCSGCPDANFAR
jgi:hypothetical protein